MVFLINDDAIFTLYNVNIEELELGNLLEFVVKEGIKLFSQSLKEYYILCVHEDTIFIYSKNVFAFFISTIQ